MSNDILSTFFNFGECRCDQRNERERERVWVRRYSLLLFHIISPFTFSFFLKVLFERMTSSLLLTFFFAILSTLATADQHTFSSIDDVFVHSLPDIFQVATKSTETNSKVIDLLEYVQRITADELSVNSDRRSSDNCINVPVLLDPGTLVTSRPGYEAGAQYINQYTNLLDGKVVSHLIMCVLCALIFLSFLSIS